MPYAHYADNYQNVNPFHHRSWCNLSGERELVIISPFMSIDFCQSDFQVHQTVRPAPRGGINYSRPTTQLRVIKQSFLTPCHFRLRLQVIYERNFCVRRFGSVQLHFWQPVTPLVKPSSSHFCSVKCLPTKLTVPLFYTAEHWAVTRCMSSSFDNSHAKCTLQFNDSTELS